MTMEDDDSDPVAEVIDRAWELATEGDYTGAMKLAEQALELEDDSPDAHNLLGHIHGASGNTDVALEHYFKAIEADEYYVEPLLNAADLLIHPVGDVAAALRILDDALAICEGEEERVEALVLKSECQLALGDRDDANRTILSLPTGPFESPRLAFLVGKARFEAGDVDTAESLLRDAKAREPHNADAPYFLGLVLETRGERDGATIELLTARMLDERGPRPPFALSQENFERRVRQAISGLSPALSDKLEGSLVVVAPLPGVEVVAEGVDPRLPVLLDDVPSAEDDADSPRRVGRCFVYQRNIERSALGPSGLADEIRYALERELTVLFPELASEIEAPPEASEDDLMANRPDDKGRAPTH